MQRKSLDNKSPNTTSTKHDSSNRRKNHPNESSAKEDDEAETTIKSPRKRDIHEILPQDSTILQMATVVDIYGPASDLIGRRSFNGFHKSIGATWDEAYKRRTESEGRRNKKGESSKISDEELLRRYEKYVKMGREKSGLNDEKKRKRKAVD